VLDGRFRFENFVVGASNRLAFSAARAIAESPISGTGNVVLCGPAGAGKTHLLAAAGHAIRGRHRDTAVGYLAVEPLIEELHSAIATGQVDLLLSEYCQWNVLLLDDIHLLSGRLETQYELLHVFSAFQNGSRRFVLTSELLPSHLSDLDERLRTMIGGAAVVDIDLPEHETRLAILQSACREHRLALDAAALEQLANASGGNGHALHAAVERLVQEAAPPPTPPRTPVTAATGVLTPPGVADSPEDEAPPDEIPGLEPVEIPDDVAPEAAPATATPASLTAAPPPDEFANFVGEITAAVSLSVDRWRTRLADGAARWAAEGFSTSLLEQALRQSGDVDLAGVEARFALAVERLRGLEREAARLDPRLAGLKVFRDPARIANAEAILLRAFAAYDPPPAPDPRLTIDSFIAGERNQRAFRAAAEVIALPGARYNPLVLYGSAGAGKTHLLLAIGNALRDRDGVSVTVACTSGSSLVAGLHDAVLGGTLERWRARHRCGDVLLIDDLHELAGDARAQEEVAQLIGALLESGKQVVVAAAVPPAHLSGLDRGLRQHLERGLAIEIGRVPEAERIARHTPVPDGAEAAAPTIDAWFDEGAERAPSVAGTAERAALGGVDSFFLDPEKCVADWPGVDGRVSEDPR
jgi:chromosomal replication initiation ATPase DnaA